MYVLPTWSVLFSSENILTEVVVHMLIHTSVVSTLMSTRLSYWYF